MNAYPNTNPMSLSTTAWFAAHAGFVVRQRIERAEYFGVETANKYDIHTLDGRLLLHAFERDAGFWDGVARQMGGHEMRTFQIDVVDANGRVLLSLAHPAAWFMQRVEVRSGNGRLLGTFEQCFAWTENKLVVKDARGRERFRSVAKFLSPWDYPFERVTTQGSRRVAFAQKHWEGWTQAIFTDADTFRVMFESRSLDADERALLLAATLFIDLVWFERNAAHRST